MISRDTASRSLRLGLALAAGLALSACARNSADNAAGAGFGAGGAGMATPGSPQDFTVNVGDRVFFDSDSSELNATAVATLDKQAQWLTRYSQYAFTVEGHADERGTREYNFALGARRAEAVKTTWRRAGSRATASAPSPTARSGPSRCATTSAAGRRTGAASPCSEAAPPADARIRLASPCLRGHASRTAGS